jgi:regulator of sirC expression with transglutaminase-like and TPR domain
MPTNAAEYLIKLLDDPDNQVFESVKVKILESGPEMVQPLEIALKKAQTGLIHSRIEELIRKLKYEELKGVFASWIEDPKQTLIEGAWLLNRYQFPELTLDDLHSRIKPLRDEIWLEINDQLTALEKIRVFNKIFFEKRAFVLNEQHPDSPGNNFIPRILDTGKGNEYSLTLFYCVVCQELNLPVFLTQMPDYPILAYLNLPFLPNNSVSPALFDTLFYINPTNQGSVHSQKDITDYLMRKAIPIEQIYYMPSANVNFIRICLERMAMDYDLAGSPRRTEEIQDLLSLWK